MDTCPSPPRSRQVAATIPGARLHVVAGEPHVPSRTHRSEVQATIGSFFAEIGL